MTTPERPGGTPTDAAAQAQLPSTHERRLHPWSWLFVLLSQLRQFVFPLLVLAFLGWGELHFVFIGLISVLVLVLVSVWQYFVYRYRIDGDSLYVRSGLIERGLRQIPFARIHNVSLQRSLLHRLFGVAEVKLESAGGTKPEAHMRVLTLDQTLALEQLIRHRTRAPASAADARDTGPATPIAAETSNQTLLSLPLGEIVRLGLISNRGMVVIGGALALAWQLPPNNIPVDTIRKLGKEVLGYAGMYDAGWAEAVLTALAFIAIVIALVRMLSILLATVKYHGFALTEHGRRLTVERGLFTRLRASVPRRRMQAWTLRESLLHRLFRRRSLEIDIATSHAEPNKEKSLQELAPVATPASCAGERRSRGRATLESRTLGVRPLAQTMIDGNRFRNAGHPAPPPGGVRRREAERGQCLRAGGGLAPNSAVCVG